MAYGGGTWLPPVQNKIMPGTYIHFASKARPSNIFGERGILAFALEVPWGEEEGLITVEPSDLQKDSMELFGLEYTDPKLMPLREALKHGKKAYVYRLNGGGKRATGEKDGLKATLKTGGAEFNTWVVNVRTSIDDPEKYALSFGQDSKNEYYFKENITSMDELNDNPYIHFEGELKQVLDLEIFGGEDGEITASDHVKFLEKLEKKFINILAYAGDDKGIKRLYESYTTRRVNMEGAYFQLVTHDIKANSELVINLREEQPKELVYWVAGAEAGCDINKSVSSQIYDGELEPFVDYKQRDLEEAIRNGDFVFHQVDKEVRVLQDINTFTDFSTEKNEDFQQNQVIRVLHQIANDWSTIFNTRYLDKEINDEVGRTVLWNDFHNHLLKLQGTRAITNVEGDDIVVEAGEAKDAVYTLAKVQPTMVMNKLYVEVVVE